MPSLSSPLVLGEARLRNRNVMSAMTRNRSFPTNVPNPYNVEYYSQRATGGAGLIVTEGTLVSQQGTEWPNAPGIWSTEQIRAWSKVVQSVHNAGGTVFCQLWHVGRLSHPDMPEHRASGKPVIAPSAIAARGSNRFRQLPNVPGYVVPTAVEDPWDLVLEYKNAAQNAKQAGFDGVELHAGGGYLPHQFLDSTSNLRTDQWGGNAERRARFVIEVVRALIEVWGYDRVGIKLTPAGGLNDVGMSLQDTIETYTFLIKQLDRLRIIYITLVRYVESMDPMIEGRRRGTDHDVLEAYREHIKRPYLFLNASISVPEAERLLHQGIVDAVVFARLWISHPDLQRRIERGVPLDTPIDWRTVNGHPEVNPKKGYTDYPFAPGTTS